MLRSIQTKMVGPCFRRKDEWHTQSWGFDFGSRINVFTGDNGLGKTVLLELVWYSLTLNWFEKAIEPFVAFVEQQEEESQSQKEPQENRLYSYDRVRQEASIEGAIKFDNQETTNSSNYDFEKEEWMHRAAMNNSNSIVIFAGAKGNYAIWDSYKTPVRDAKYENKPWWGSERDEKLPDALKFTSDEVMYGMRRGGTVWCRGLISDWIFWNSDSRSSMIADALQAAIAALSLGSEPMRNGPPQRHSALDAEIYPTIHLPYGNIPINHLSAGMRRVIEIAYLIVWAWSESTTVATLRQRDHAQEVIVLVDELELHLHPRWQRTVLPSLVKAIKAVGSALPKGGTVPDIQIFVTTHSPLVLASLEQEFNGDTDKVTILEYTPETDSVGLKPYNMSRKGDASSWLTSPVFGLGTARSLDGEQALKRATEFLRGTDHADETDIELDLEKALPDNDPFWVIWNLRKYTSKGSD